MGAFTILAGLPFLVAVGLLLVTGVWEQVISTTQSWSAGFTTGF